MAIIIKTLVALLIGLALASVRLAVAQQSKVYRIGVVTAGGAWYEVIDGAAARLKQLGLEYLSRWKIFSSQASRRLMHWRSC